MAKTDPWHSKREADRKIYHDGTCTGGQQHRVVQPRLGHGRAPARNANAAGISAASAERHFPVGISSFPAVDGRDAAKGI